MPSRPARHQVQRSKARACYERTTIHAIFDAGMLAHVAFCSDGQPFAIPMLYARDGDALLLHGSIASRLIGELGHGIAACVSVTHLDGLVLARSHFDHSVNYRSVVAFGHARIVDDADAKAAALARFVDTLIPGRASEARAADRSELAATHVLRFEIEDASAKVRSGGVKDNPADRALPYWAGVVPLHTRYGLPLPDADLAATIGLPPSVARLLEAGSVAS
ncbi:MAG: pyridoxamine 5'-phosphate oxidase family protein [Dokdonella sp.]|uniref:pyridoxamine 5'-phosphate oxidase family protein n=1 Tax=Dokdonella sp. TaxID=2291710 RepID=UPI0025B88B20|nr:pyridoxamine 5'-phosphate oxidase family protein [Dokdonella sp.]MBX3700032.1 pyridoxamine 5'-phosphate oxidase family protein [Dokdonella sp.]MCW5577479.1 pyridoxamine 5'-phosphate oxidase family protein [Dokdonella sp.]